MANDAVRAERLANKADALLEECARRHMALVPTLKRFLPEMSRALGAVSATVSARGDGKKELSVSHGPGPHPTAAALAAGRLPRGRRWVWQRLDVAGKRVGSAAFSFKESASRENGLRHLVRAVCEELDDVLFGIETAALKQGLVESITRSLTRHVFDDGLDDGVRALRGAVPFTDFAVVYLDEGREEGARVLYRVYRGGRLDRSPETRPHAGLARAIRLGPADLLRDEGGVARVLGLDGADSFPLIAGVAQPRRLGAVIARAPGGLDAFGRDVLQIFANAVSQRLVDYNRERRHLGQFFPPTVIDELLREPDYQEKHLAARVAQIGILYADINSFTKICERALKRPALIGNFVNRWSAEAVEIVWRNGGVFDKMVGDCVIALFGPPFFRGSGAERAAAALKTAFEIQAFTKRLQAERDFAPLPRRAGIPGLGVAVGVNLCPAAVGLFGPNQDLTAFGRGMNETARLQSHAGFRETLAMEGIGRLLDGKALGRGLAFSGPLEAKVKNVGKALRYYRVTRRS